MRTRVVLRFMRRRLVGAFPWVITFLMGVALGGYLQREVNKAELNHAFRSGVILGGMAAGLMPQQFTIREQDDPKPSPQCEGAGDNWDCL